jgi:hypothetical protein
MTEASPQNKISFYERFNWAVPTAFKDPVGSCWFEAEDSLYDTQKAYTCATWGKSLEYVSCGIRVKSPKRGIVSGEEGDAGLAFKRNWNSEVVLEFTRYKEAEKKQLVLPRLKGGYSLF